MIEDKIDDSSCVTPWVYIEDEKFDYAEIDEDYDEGDDNEEEVGIFFS